MSSRRTNSWMACLRSQSPIRRCTSGSGSRRRSARGGKSPAGAARAGSARADPATPARPENCTPASPQRRAGGSRSTAGPDIGPSPTASWPPRETVPPSAADGRSSTIAASGVLRPEVAPVVTPLAVGSIFADQPTARRRPVGPHPPAAHGHEPAAQPALAPLPPAHRAATPAWAALHQRVGPAAPPRRAGGWRPRSRSGRRPHAARAAIQAIQEVGIVAVVGVGGDTGVGHAQGVGLVEQGQGDLAAWSGT